jgi:hypothetical protein
MECGRWNEPQLLDRERRYSMAVFAVFLKIFAVDQVKVYLGRCDTWQTTCFLTSQLQRNITSNPIAVTLERWLFTVRSLTAATFNL